jgi:hypothetical protein
LYIGPCILDNAFRTMHFGPHILDLYFGPRILDNVLNESVRSRCTSSLQSDMSGEVNGNRPMEQTMERQLTDALNPNHLDQRFSNFFQVGTTFISQNVLRTTPLLSALTADCLRFSTIVCDTQFTLILFFLSFFD